MLRGRDEVDIELVTHTSSHITSDGTKATTKSLKVRGDYDSRQIFSRSLLECLKKGQNDLNLTVILNTGKQKLIPFAQNNLLYDQMTELIISKIDIYMNCMQSPSILSDP